ncbi:Cap3p [Coccidioides immitis H538.4]|uniref:Cap3p n=1 Tax=Coccidioides immitis H538.4 TaxID=396776 RepID=A0A0J8RYJ2_COCIT|nr:Cap3p [Coccidioides immitis H538.4]
MGTEWFQPMNRKGSLEAALGMRFHRVLALLGLAVLVWISLSLIRTKSAAPVIPASGSTPKHDEPLRPASPPSPADKKTHPIARLINQSKSSWDGVRSRQSKTLKEAVEEYRRRYKLSPPPNFDVWFEFAQSKGVELIDEYDTIYHSLLPFWSLQPKTIRDRVKESLGFDNALIGVLIRDGKISLVDGGGNSQQWKRDALTGMMQRFIRYLPNMDLAFNTHDEPRVVLPSDDLQRLVSNALDTVIPKVAKHPVDNSWTSPTDLNKGDRINETKTTRFNWFAHQATWTTSRSSCPIDTPVRDLNENARDKIEAYLSGDLGFIYNTTAFSDICLSPSLRYAFGMFERPNAMSVVRDLFPIFSESKVSSFQDILYPSPWYWSGKVTYDPKLDVSWDNKKSQVYWRGSTTGGFSRAGGWRRQHRQLFVKNINAVDDVKVLENKEGNWTMHTVKQNTFTHLLNVSFSHVGQCDPEDCNAQSHYFNIVKPDSQHEAWRFKYLADVDGNAFSGRFYALLKSNSLVYKLAVFREWHTEWIQPWVHYVPLSLRGNEHIEAIRYFASEEEGQRHAKFIAQGSSSWAKKALKNDALEVWFFRLLLEYGRIVDDNREKIGFSFGSS